MKARLLIGSVTFFSLCIASCSTFSSSSMIHEATVEAYETYKGKKGIAILAIS